MCLYLRVIVNRLVYIIKTVFFIDVIFTAVFNCIIQHLDYCAIITQGVRHGHFVWRGTKIDWRIDTFV